MTAMSSETRQRQGRYEAHVMKLVERWAAALEASAGPAPDRRGIGYGDGWDDGVRFAAKTLRQLAAAASIDCPCGSHTVEETTRDDPRWQRNPLSDQESAS